MFHQFDRCRLCGNKRLRQILDLGVQALTGVFPHTRDERVGSGPLELMNCDRSLDASRCGLVQLRHSYDSGAMYGENYGYRSSLNPSMVSHLRDVVGMLTDLVRWDGADLIVDIGSNDGTLLSFYPEGRALVGIDPTAARFREHYRPDIEVITEFFGGDLLRSRFPERRARIVTSIAMFYDLADPLAFAREVCDVLDDLGVWHFEQSYLPLMLSMNAYDTVCHEHVEYYALHDMVWICERAGLKIIRLETNRINGGSFAVTAARADSPYPECSLAIAAMLDEERDQLRDEALEAFSAGVARHRDELRAALTELEERGLKVLGYGASTKGNVLLQYCGLGPEEIPCIAEVNEDKFGRFTPGTGIPIVSEAEARAMRPDVFLVLPWHFREFICEKERELLDGGGRLLFPLPSVEIVSS